MTNRDIILQRLRNQRLADQKFDSPEQVVHWLGAVQSQDYAGAKWSVGQRVAHGTDAAVERAIEQGTILRTHILRPTWHFVLPADIRWMLQVTAPRIHALNAYYFCKTELDGSILGQCHELITNELQDSQTRTRPELAAVLDRAGIVADGLRLSYIMMHAELEQLVCNGPRRGKQQTYMLLDERAPSSSRFTHEEALAKLTRRFFMGHGPATINDYVKWASLSVADARAGMEMVRQHFQSEVVEGRTYWFADIPAAGSSATVAYLIPEYDESVNAYRDLGIELAPDARPGILERPLIIDGLTVGSWKRTIVKKEVEIIVDLFVPLTTIQNAALDAVIQRYSTFIEMSVTLRTSRVTLSP